MGVWSGLAVWAQMRGAGTKVPSHRSSNSLSNLDVTTLNATRRQGDGTTAPSANTFPNADQRFARAAALHSQVSTDLPQLRDLWLLTQTKHSNA